MGGGGVEFSRGKSATGLARRFSGPEYMYALNSSDFSIGVFVVMPL